MSASPAFANTPNKGTPQKITAANTSLEPTSGLSLVFTAGASGSFVRKLIARHLGTNSGATVLRVFRNNGSSEAVAANNALIAEKTIAGNTLSQTAESISYEVVLNLPLAGGGTPERLYCTIGTAATAGIMVSPDAGDF